MSIAGRDDSPELYRLFFGKKLKIMSVVVSAIIIVIPAFLLFELPALIPLPSFPVPSIPCDYLALAGILFFMVIILRKPWSLLRFPRHNSLPFILGLTWQYRQRSCMSFTKRKMLECLVFLSVFFFIRYGLVFTFDHNWSLIDLVFPEIPVFLLFCILSIFSDHIVRAIPCSKKEYVIHEHHGKEKKYAANYGTMFLSIAHFVAYAIRRPAHTVIVRMILYILRRDMAGTLFLHTAAVIICGVVVVLLPPPVELLVRILLLSVPIFLLNEHQDSIRLSVLKTIDCPYWSFTSRQIIAAGIYLCAIIYVPYALLFAVRQIFFNNAVQTAEIVNFIVSSAALCTVAGRSFYTTAWQKKEQNTSLVMWAGSVILCTLMPLLGIAFSIVLIIVNFIYIQKNNWWVIRTDENTLQKK